MLEDHERKLEHEMLEAAKSVADVAHVEKDPLLIILWRLNHQDRTQEEIRVELAHVRKTLDNHITRDSTIQDSIDEMVSMWKGSKLVSKIITWFFGISAAAIGIAATIGAAWATAKRWFS